MFNLPRLLRSVLPAATLALSLAAAPGASHAVTIGTSYDIGLEHAESYPYNFTGRVFILDAEEVASGTLIRRHTVLTAAHVAFDPTLGFFTNLTFTRGLYEDVSLSKQQVVSTQALSGYQTALTAANASTLSGFLAAESRDLGLLLIADPPVDKTWGEYTVNPTALSDTTNEFFVLGYPAETFDGLTMAYIVPGSAYTQLGANDTGLYENDSYQSEGGESGGPVYVYDRTTKKRLIVGETTSGFSTTEVAGNATFIRAIDSEASQFIASAEYTSGLIAKVKIKGPRTVTHGTTVIYTALPKFSTPDTGSTSPVTTTRYTEVKLKTSTPGTSTTPAVTIKKLSNTKFAVTFAATIRPRSTTTLTANYSKTTAVANSTITITVQ